MIPHLECALSVTKVSAAPARELILSLCGAEGPRGGASERRQRCGRMGALFGVAFAALLVVPCRRRVPQNPLVRGSFADDDPYPGVLCSRRLGHARSLRGPGGWGASGRSVWACPCSQGAAGWSPSRLAGGADSAEAGCARAEAGAWWRRLDFRNQIIPVWRLARLWDLISVPLCDSESPYPRRCLGAAVLPLTTRRS